MQDIAYGFTEQDIREIKAAVAAVEQRGLKVCQGSVHLTYMHAWMHA